MKKAILILLLLPIIASSQSFNVFDIDTSEYPIMKAKFYSIDENDDQILNHTTSDFEITENGNPAEVLSVSCPEPNELPISIGIMVDTKSQINLVKKGTEKFIDLLKMPQNELGITYMDIGPLLLQSFTKDKQKARNSTRLIPPASGGTNLSDMFFNQYAGGIEIIKNREIKNKVLILISDLEHCPSLNIDEQKLFQQANDNNIRIYTVLIGIKDDTGLFQRIATNTGGEVFQDVWGNTEFENALTSILINEQNDFCDLSWMSNPTCKFTLNIGMLEKSSGQKTESKIYLNEGQHLSFELKESLIDLGSNGTDTTITITSKNGPQTINQIIFEPDNGNYEVLTPLPIIIPANDSAKIDIRFKPIDESKEYSRMIMVSDYCSSSVGLLRGSKNRPLLQRALELTHPNGGEIFAAGSDTVITWEGVSEKEKIEINFSSDNGVNWTNIDSFGVDLKHNWAVPNIQSDNCLISIEQNLEGNTLALEEGEIEWQRSYGGSKFEGVNSISSTFDGGYIIAGSSISDDGDITNPKNLYSYWIVKLDSDGELEWQKTYGGDKSDQLYSISQTMDGGYIVAGYSNSSSGDISNPKESYYYWILKLKPDGELEWEKSFGGNRFDVANSAIQTMDGGYIVAGRSTSTDRVLPNIGWYDAWIIKLSSNGEIEWQKSYGGRKDDSPYAIVQTTDGGYIIAGETKTEDEINNGNDIDFDYWVVKMKPDGELEWEKTYGGSDQDRATSIVQTTDGGYAVAGYSNSADGNITNANGDYDYWIVKLEIDGEIEWQKSYGGSQYDRPNSIVQTFDGGYIVTGGSKSSDGDVTNAKGENDYWVLKLKPDGELDWQKSYGGSSDDYSSSIVQSADGGYAVAGSSSSTDGDITDNKGDTDMWVLKIAGPPQPLQSDTSDAVFSIIMPEPVIQNTDIDMGEMIVGNTKDTVVSSVICNTGDAPLHVLGVDITGGDDGDFLIPRGAGDFYLEKDQCQDMMFEFTPSALGTRTAVATIRTTIGDFTDTINIHGVGINPFIEATTDVVDFGQFELGDSKDTTVVLIKNVGAEDITITETKITGPDMEQFDMVPLPSFTLTSGEPKNIDLNYTARYGGRTSSIIEFHYNGVGSPLRSMLFAEGIGGEVYPQIPDAYVGERVELGLHLGRIKPEGLDEVATNFTATVSYNSTLLAPIDKNMTVTTENTTSFIKIEGQLSGVSQIATVPMKVGLGTTVSSGLVVTEFQLYNANGDSVDYEIEPGVGEFNVLGICDEGGARLINPNGEQVGLKVTQNQKNTNATVSLNLIESGQTDLIIYDQLGNAVETAYSGTPSTGTKELNIDLSNFANGRYYIKLVTPTVTKTEIIEVVR